MKNMKRVAKLKKAKKVKKAQKLAAIRGLNSLSKDELVAMLQETHQRNEMLAALIHKLQQMLGLEGDLIGFEKF